MLRRVLQICVALLIVTIGIFLMLALIRTAPKAEKVPLTRAAPSVEFVVAQSKEISLRLPSQGEVLPIRQTSLTAEVAGKIIFVSPKFEVGGQFEEEEVLVAIEETNYLTELSQAKLALREAQLAWQMEKSRESQARRDWEKLGKGQPASDLLLRVPQLKAATARIEAAQSSLKLAEKNVERTKIRAPFPCQIEGQSVDLGATVRPGTEIARILSSAPPEIRLPLSLEDAPLVRSGSPDDPGEASRFWARSQSGLSTDMWTGRIVRSENKVDAATRTIYYVGLFDGESPPPLGLFVDVEVEARTLHNLFELPRGALREGNILHLIDANETLQYTEVEVVRTTTDHVYIQKGLQNGDRVSTTLLSTSVDGMAVTPQP